ncbi:MULTISPECIES: hypothetical protein [unclassified Microcoleus]
MKDNLFGRAIALFGAIPFGIASLHAFFELQMQADKRGWTQMKEGAIAFI